MKKLLLAILLVLGAFSTLRADDIADATAAFNTFIAYQKTSDERTLDLFASDCAVTITQTDGTNTKDIVLPTEMFRDAVAKGIARKQGSKDVYEDVKFTQEGATVKVTSTLLHGDSGKRGPFSAVYVKDGSGQWKVKTINVTLPMEKLPGGAP